MKRLVGICMGVVVFVGFLYSQEKDPALEFVENAIKIYPDSVWIDPEYLEYLPDDVKEYINKYPKTKREFEVWKKNVLTADKKIRLTFEIIRDEIVNIAMDFGGYVYWKKRGIDLNIWEERILTTFEKRRKFTKFVENMRGTEIKKIDTHAGIYFKRGEKMLENSPLFYSDAVIEGVLIKIERHPEDLFYRTWYYFKVEKRLFGEERKDTIIVKIPAYSSYKYGGGYLFAHSYPLLLREKDIGDSFILFLTKFPFYKLFTLPYGIYEYKMAKKREGKGTKYISILENQFLKLWREDKNFQELEEGEYEPVYKGDALRKVNDKLGWVCANKWRILKGEDPSDWISYDDFIRIINNLFNRRK